MIDVTILVVFFQKFVALNSKLCVTGQRHIPFVVQIPRQVYPVVVRCVFFMLIQSVFLKWMFCVIVSLRRLQGTTRTSL